MTHSALLPMRPHSDRDGQNARLHWRQRAQRARTWRVMAMVALAQAQFPEPLPDNGRGYVVRLTIRQRLGPLADSDGVSGMLKACRDGIASFLGVTDDGRGPTWKYEIERGPDNVLIEMETP